MEIERAEEFCPSVCRAGKKKIRAPEVPHHAMLRAGAICCGNSPPIAENCRRILKRVTCTPLSTSANRRVRSIRPRAARTIALRCALLHLRVRQSGPQSRRPPTGPRAGGSGRSQIQHPRPAPSRLPRSCASGTPIYSRESVGGSYDFVVSAAVPRLFRGGEFLMSGRKTPVLKTRATAIAERRGTLDRFVDPIILTQIGRPWRLFPSLFQWKRTERPSVRRNNTEARRDKA